MRDLSTNILREMTNPQGISIPRTLYHLELKDKDTGEIIHIRLTNHDQDINFQGNDYLSYSVKHSNIKSYMTNQVGNCNVTIDNVDRSMSAYFAYNDFAGQKAEIFKVFLNATGSPIDGYTAWLSNTGYNVGDISVPVVSNGFSYSCIVAGTSDASNEPTWPETIGETVLDGTVTWKCTGTDDDKIVQTIGVMSTPKINENQISIRITNIFDRSKTFTPWRRLEEKCNWEFCKEHCTFNMAQGPVRGYATTDGTNLKLIDSNITFGITIDDMGDLNGDGVIDSSDLAIIDAAMGSVEGDGNWNPAADINGDGTVDQTDRLVVEQNLNKTSANYLNDYIKNASLKILSGANKGEIRKISDYDQGTNAIHVSSPFTSHIKAGTRYIVECDKSLNTCKNLFSLGTGVGNEANYGGFVSYQVFDHPFWPPSNNAPAAAVADNSIIPIIYGTGRTKGIRMGEYLNEFNNPLTGDRLHVLCIGEIDSVISCSVNGNDITNYTFYSGSEHQSFDFHGESLYYRHTAMLSIEMNYGNGGWNKGGEKGFEVDDEVVVDVKGIKVQKYLPDGTPNGVPIWSDNPVWCILDFLMERSSKKMRPSDINFQSFYDAAQLCDTFGYKMNIVISKQKKEIDILTQMLIPCRGYFTYTSGKMELNIEHVWIHPKLGDSTPAHYFDDTTNPLWQAQALKREGDIVRLNPDNGKRYKCIVAGETGVAVPAWPQYIGGTVLDNTVTWECIDINDNIVAKTFEYFEKEINDTANRIIVNYVDQDVRENVSLITNYVSWGSSVIQFSAEDLRGNFENSGTIYIGNAVVTYTGNTDNTLSGCQWSAQKVYDPAGFFPGYPVFQGKQLFEKMTAFYNDYDNQDKVHRVIDKKISADTIPTYRQAYAIAEWKGRKSSEGNLYCSYKGMIDAMHLTVGDVVKVTHELSGWQDATFRIIEASEGENEEIKFTLQVYDESFYIENDESPGVSLKTSLPHPNAVPATPLGLALNSGTDHLLQGNDGNIISRIQVSWIPDQTNPFIEGYEVEYKKSTEIEWLPAAQLYGAHFSKTYIAPVVDGISYDVRMRSMTSSDAKSEWTSLSHIVIGKTAPPSNISNLTATTRDFSIFLSWDAIDDIDFQEYEIREGVSWETGILVDRIRATTYIDKMAMAGTFNFWIKAIDTSGNYSVDATTASISINSPSQPLLSSTIAGDSVILNWTTPVDSFPIDEYELRYGNDWETGTFVATMKATSYKVKIDWSGTRKYMIVAIDVAGNESAPGGVDIVINLPGLPSISPEVIDNFVLLKWNAVQGTLPISFYQIRKGEIFETASALADINSNFSSFFESNSGTYRYWVVAVDSAGNFGPEASVSVFVNEPPDYVLNASWNSDFSGLRTNAIAEAGKGLLLPVETGETYEQHFTNGAWNSPQDQVNAGAVRFMMPSKDTATYEEVFDYGTVLAATLVRVIPTLNNISGSVAMSQTVSIRKLPTDPWIDYPDVSQIYATDFQYVKVKCEFTASGGDDLTYVSSLNVKLDSKLKNDAGKGTANASDTEGTVVNFKISFVDVISITVTPNAPTPVVPVYDFADEPNPIGFNVYLYDLAGNRVSGDFSWAAKGY